MRMTTIQVILNTNHRRNAAKSLGLVPGSDEFKAFSGPTFVEPDNWDIGDGVLHVKVADGTKYYYPLHTISRVKVTTK